MEEKIKPGILILAIAVVILLVGCGKSAKTAENATSGITNNVPVAYFSITELASKSDLIIVGEVVEPIERINMARLPDNPDEPDPNIYGIGQVYRVKVEQWLKGKSEAEVFLAKSAGLITADSKTISAEKIDQAIQSSGEVLPSIGKRYLMFLQTSRHIYEDYPQDQIFVIPGHPWLFDLSNENCIVIEDQYTEMSAYFPPRSLRELKLMVDDPIYARKVETGNPYPSLDVQAACSMSSLNAYPAPEKLQSNPIPYP